jgi:UDP-glucose 4-epimerase
MKLLLTGGAGFIGSNIAELLVKKGHSLTIIDNLVTGKKERLDKIIDKIDFYKMDIRNKKDIEKIIVDFDGIIHQAALTSVTDSFKKSQEYQDVNVIGTKNIFEIAQKEKIRTVYASSASVYGNVKKLPIKENDKLEPINPYGKTKLDCDILAKQYNNTGSSIIGLRYFNVYGIGQTASYAGVITKFLENIKIKKPLIINGKGNQIRDFIHVQDIAKANLVAIESKINKGFFNIGTGIKTSINELANIMIDNSNCESDIIHGPQFDGDVENSLADMTLTKKSLKWNHEINLKIGLKDLIQNYLSKN